MYPTKKPIPNTAPYPPNFAPYPINARSDEVDNSKKMLMNNSSIMNEIDQYEYSLLSLNVRSLNKNIDDLRCLVADLKVDFISLCEIFNPLKNYVNPFSTGVF